MNTSLITSTFPLPGIDNTLGLILSGGQGRRAGGLDKGWLKWQGKPLIERQCDWMNSQGIEFCISANRNIERYNGLGVPVITDTENGFQGPLRGIESALKKITNEWLLVVPVDVPKLNRCLFSHMISMIRSESPLFYVATDQREHYLCQLINRQLYPHLAKYLASGERRVKDFIKLVGGSALQLDLPESEFTNLNKLEQYGSE